MKKIKTKKSMPTKGKTKPKTKFKFKPFRNLSVGRTILYSILGLGIIGATLALVFALYIILTAPNFEQELLYEREATIIYDVNGNELVRVGSNNVELVTYEQLPQVLIDAIIATEDSRFFQHTGLDAPRFVVAAVGTLLGNDDAGGASTLSMQVIKNTYTDAQATTGFSGIARKFTDVYMSIFKLENAYTKEEIIEFYVNSQWLGHDGNKNYTGITGVEQASQYFFGKSVSMLSLSEASLLAGMFQNPYSLNPYNFPENAKARQETVLNLMVRHGYITDEERDNAIAIPLEDILTPYEFDSTNYLQASIDYVLDETEEKTGLNPYTTPMEIYTTLDPEIQQTLHSLETGEIYSIPEARGNLQFGLAITNTENGGITALSGGINYAAKGTNRAITRRQPGSTAKLIFDYAPYIEYLDGSPGTYFLDEPYTYSSGQPLRNYDREYKGLMTIRDAVADSRNVTALKAFHAVMAYDPNAIGNFANSLGIDYGASLYESAAIGAGIYASPLEMSAAYAAFARGGYYIEPYSVTKIVFIESGEEYEYNYTLEKVMSEETAYLITDALLTSEAEAFSISGTDVGAKTGTSSIDEDVKDELGINSNSIMDSWVVHFNPEYSTGIWIGYDKLSNEFHETKSEGYFTQSQASSIRNAISKAIGTRIYSTNQRFSAPSGVTYATVEKYTFPLQLASPYTPENMKMTEIFKRGTEPTEVSTRYSALSNVTNTSASFDGTQITLTWDPTAIPDAINPTYLTEHFNTYYEDSAVKYYEERLLYNQTYIGNLMYDVYLDNNGSLELVASVTGNSVNYLPPTIGTEYKFVIKTSYSIFKTNASTGVNLTVSTSIDSNTEDLVEP